MRWAALALLAGCGTSDPPSCQASVGHFYAVGCSFFDGSGAPYTESQSEQSCVQISAAAPSQCLGALDDYLSCLDAATGSSCAACAGKQQALVQCR